jgi:hypothetical protein
MKPLAENPSFLSRPIYSDIYPLDEFYAARGEELPDIVSVRPDLVSEPYRSLLVHHTDMTSTLEKFYGESLHIEVLARYVRENEYYREVVLVLDRSKKRVEFGAIKINLNLFPSEARDEILREQKPLGRILNNFNVPFSSRPATYMRVISDAFISTALQSEPRSYLFGRRNSLLDNYDRPLAEIVEILPL